MDKYKPLTNEEMEMAILSMHRDLRKMNSILFLCVLGLAGGYVRKIVSKHHNK